jgi:hypothetical protein
VSQPSNPRHRIVYALIKRPDGRTYWLRAGLAVRNRDGSENVYLDVLPIDGKLQIRADERKEDTDKNPPPPPESGA